LADGGGAVPIGIAWSGAGLVVNDWNLAATIDTEPGRSLVMPYGMPFDPGVPPEAEQRGRFFFYTAQGRWSFRDVGSCASCHPAGLSDGVTWVFSTGPRQTPPLDGTFAKGDPTDHRAQNWTAVFDEVYDVEGVTRNVLGGKGAITDAMDAPI